MLVPFFIFEGGVRYDRQGRRPMKPITRPQRRLLACLLPETRIYSLLNKCIFGRSKPRKKIEAICVYMFGFGEGGHQGCWSQRFSS